MDKINLSMNLMSFREMRANRYREDCIVLADQNEIIFRRVLSHLQIFWQYRTSWYSCCTCPSMHYIHSCL